MARSVGNTLDAVLLTVVLATSVLAVVGLLFSLVGLLGSTAVGLAVLDLSSFVEIVPLPCHPHQLYQQCKKKENDFLPQWPMFY